MKKKIWIYIVTIVVVFAQYSCGSIKQVDSQKEVAQISLKTRLKSIPEVVEVNKLDITDHFIEHYEVWFKQQIDPNNPSLGTFKQRVLVAHVDDDAPVIVELQGYQIYSGNSGELASMFNANQITIEHRFFADSKPKGELPWAYLTVENAAADQHRIIEVLRKALYPNNKFVSTGISKGGQTTMIHRSMYPNDVDVSVCYVAPLNFEREDQRIYHFLDTVGTVDQRAKIENFQKLCFERKDQLLVELQREVDENGYEWDIPIEQAFEYYVLEYSFAFWQWGASSFSQIPDGGASADSLIDHVLNVSGVSFFESSGVENLRPFFWAAMSEMGMYGYQFKPFEQYLSKKEDYTFEFTFPEGHTPVYSSKPMEDVNSFIQNEATKMMFIYGARDTWSATAVQLSEKATNRGLRKYVNPTGHHGTRIKSFDEEQRAIIIGELENWIGTKAVID